MIIRDLLVRLGLTGEREVESGLKGINGSAQATVNTMNVLGGVLAGVFSALTISNIAKTADGMQSLEARLNNMPQTLNNGAEAFDAVAQHANAARMSIDAYANFMLRVGNATEGTIKSQDELLEVTDTVSKALVVGGATAEEQSSALLQFAQALGSGVLQGDEFKSMAEAAPQLLNAIGKALNIPRENLKQFAADGKLTTQQILKALKQIGPQFDAQFKRMPLTLSQATTIMGNRWDTFIHRMNRSSGAITWIATKFLWLADKIESGLNTITKALGGAENAVKLFAAVLGSGAILTAVWALSAALTAAASPLFIYAALLTAALLAGEDFYTWMKGGDSVLGDWFGNFDQYRETFDKFIKGLNAVKDAVGGWQNIFEAFAVYLGTKWLVRVLATLATAARAAFATGAAISSAESGGSSGVKGKGKGSLLPGAALLGFTLNDVFGDRAAEAKAKGMSTGEYLVWKKQQKDAERAGAETPTQPSQNPLMWAGMLGGPGSFMVPPGGLMAAAQTKTTVITATSSPTVSVTVQAQPGQSADNLGEVLADKVRNIFGDLNAATAREIQNNAGAR